MKAVMMTSFGQYRLTEQGTPIKASGVDVGGGRDIDHLLYQTTVGALQAVDYKGPNRQYVEAEKLIIELWN